MLETEYAPGKGGFSVIYNLECMFKAVERTRVTDRRDRRRFLSSVKTKVRICIYVEIRATVYISDET